MSSLASSRPRLPFAVRLPSSDTLSLRCVAVVAWLTAAFTLLASAKPDYQNLIPNGNLVKRNGVAWPSVGHLVSTASAGSSANNQFGLDFAAASHIWTAAFCKTDSDGDTFSNGEELGDPYCEWTVDNRGTTVRSFRNTDISHPGFADSVPSDVSQARTTLAPATTASPYPASKMPSSCNYTTKTYCASPLVCCSLYDTWRLQQDPTSLKPTESLPFPTTQVALSAPWCCDKGKFCGPTTRVCLSTPATTPAPTTPEPEEQAIDDSALSTEIIVLIVISVVFVVGVGISVGCCVYHLKIKEAVVADTSGATVVPMGGGGSDSARRRRSVVMLNVVDRNTGDNNGGGEGGTLSTQSSLSSSESRSLKPDSPGRRRGSHRYRFRQESAAAPGEITDAHAVARHPGSPRGDVDDGADCAPQRRDPPPRVSSLADLAYTPPDEPISSPHAVGLE